MVPWLLLESTLPFFRDPRFLSSTLVPLIVGKRVPLVIKGLLRNLGIAHAADPAKADTEHVQHAQKPQGQLPKHSEPQTL